MDRWRCGAWRERAGVGGEKIVKQRKRRREQKIGECMKGRESERESERAKERERGRARPTQSAKGKNI